MDVIYSVALSVPVMILEAIFHFVQQFTHGQTDLRLDCINVLNV